MSAAPHRLLNLLTALSLLLCVAVVVLWVRSYGNNVHPMLDVMRPTVLYRGIAWNSEGRAGLSLDRFSWATPAPVEPIRWRRFERGIDPLDSWVFARRRGGDGVQVAGMDFYFRHMKSIPPEEEAATTYGGVVVPHAYVVALCLALPVFRLSSFMGNRQRRRKNLCPRCGYDLHATPGRCPECGETMQSATLP